MPWLKVAGRPIKGARRRAGQLGVRALLGQLQVHEEGEQPVAARVLEPLLVGEAGVLLVPEEVVVGPVLLRQLVVHNLHLLAVLRRETREVRGALHRPSDHHVVLGGEAA